MSRVEGGREKGSAKRERQGNEGHGEYGERRGKRSERMVSGEEGGDATNLVHASGERRDAGWTRRGQYELGGMLGIETTYES